MFGKDVHYISRMMHRLNKMRKVHFWIQVDYLNIIILKLNLQYMEINIQYMYKNIGIH